MKYLLVIRHAKSSWNNDLLADFDRPLNERGNHDAPIMAKRLLEKDVVLGAVISSTAIRAFSTAVYFAKTYGINKVDIIRLDKLYQAPPRVFYEVIEAVDDSFDCIAIVSHNPGITEFVNELTETKIDDMPTCGIFAVEVPIKSWKDFAKGEKDFWFFDSPKN